MDHQELVTFEEVLEAADRLKGVANPTPILTSRTLNERFECEIYCKAENFQRVGAFKFRGAYNALSVLSPEEKAKGIITFSSGNHAQALALAAKLQGCSLLVIMPSDAPQAKLEATRGYGAEVILYERDEVAREELGAQIIAESGRTLIHPYDNRHVIAGQGTVGKELHEAVPDLDIVLVPVGGGGLMSGTLVSSKAINPSVETYGVEPEAGDDVARSFRTGTLQSVHDPQTIADGARTPSASPLTFAHIKEMACDIVTASDKTLLEIARFYLERMKVLVEPTGCLSLAPIWEGTVPVKGKKIGVVISGGNTDVRNLYRKS